MKAAGVDPAIVDVGVLAVAGLLRARTGDVLVVEPRDDGGVVLFRGGRLTALRVVDAPSGDATARASCAGPRSPCSTAPRCRRWPCSHRRTRRARSRGALGGEPLSPAAELPGWCASAPVAHLRAIALAARAAGVTPLGLDFRTGELSYHAPSEEAWRQLRVAGILAAAVVLLAIVAFGAAVAGRRAELAGLRAEVARAVGDVLPGAAPGTERTRLQGAIDTLESRRKVLGGAASGRPPTLELLRAINEAVPAQVPVTVDDFAIDDDGIRLHARTDSYESVDVVKRALQSVPGLHNPEVKDVKAGVDGRIEFRVGLRFAPEDRA